MGRLPIAFTCNANQTSTKAIISPVVERIPIRTTSFKQVANVYRRERGAGSVSQLCHLVVFSLYRLRCNQVRILSGWVFVAFNVQFCGSQPTSSRQFTCATFMDQSFPAIREEILHIRFSIAPFQFTQRATIITRGSSSNVIYFSIFVRPIRRIARAFIRAFSRNHVDDFFKDRSFVSVFLVRTFIFVSQGVSDMIDRMRRRELVMFFNVVRYFSDFRHRDFASRDVNSPMFLWSQGNGPKVQFAIHPISMVVFARMTYRSTSYVSNCISFGTRIVEAFSQDISNTRVYFPAVGHIMTVIFRSFYR